MYVYLLFILQQDNTQNIKTEGQQGSEALTAARNKTRKPCCRRESARCRCNFRSIDQEHDK